MAKKDRMFNNVIVEEPKVEEIKVEEIQESVTEEAPAFNPSNKKNAYSLIENEGKYHVISVEFDPNTLVSGRVKKIESNTDKYLMQERLQVLLMAEDLV